MHLIRYDLSQHCNRVLRLVFDFRGGLYVLWHRLNYCTIYNCTCRCHWPMIYGPNCNNGYDIGCVARVSAYSLIVFVTHIEMMPGNFKAFHLYYKVTIDSAPNDTTNKCTLESQTESFSWWKWYLGAIRKIARKTHKIPIEYMHSASITDKLWVFWWRKKKFECSNKQHDYEKTISVALRRSLSISVDLCPNDGGKPKFDWIKLGNIVLRV